MDKLPELNERLQEYLQSDSKILLMKNGNAEFFSKENLKLHILAARKTFLNAGVRQGDLVIFQIDSSKKRAFLSHFFALVSLGAAPALLSAAHNKDQVTRLAKIAEENSNAPIIADEETAQFIRFFWKDLDPKRMLIAREENPDLNGIESEISYAKAKPEDAALVLYSSGSTSDPKGVVMPNDSFLKALKNLQPPLKLSSKDTWLMWLPLEHIFGVLAGMSFPMYYDSDIVHMNAADFIQNPKSWLDAIHKTRASKTAAPNFAYPMILKALNGSENWDLSCLDFILNGGEPLSRILVEEFEKATERFQVRKNVIVPVYGLTEALGAVCFNTQAEYPELDLNALQAGIDFDLTAIKRGDMDLICQGRALPGMQMKIFDENHRMLPELTVGEIHIQSENLFSGYLNQNNAGLFHDGWFDTGDLGFLYKEMLYVVGRKKDMFFIHGKNVYLRDIEQIVSKKYPFRIAACGENNLQTGENAVYLFVETDASETVPIQALKTLIFSEMGLSIKEVVPVKQLIRTSVGKIAKQKTLAAYKEGKL